MNDIFAGLYERLDEFGYTFLGVGGDEETPTFTYSIGADRVGHPDLIVFGLPPQAAQPILDDILSTDGEVVECVRTDLTANAVPLLLVKCDEDEVREFNTFAQVMANDVEEPHATLQVVWPDASGNWPWQPEFDAGCYIPACYDTDHACSLLEE